MSDRIHVVTAADERFSMQVAVLATSLREAHRGQPLTLWVISPEAAPKVSWPEDDAFHVEPLAAHAALPGEAIPDGHYLPALATARLFVAEQLPRDILRAIYLDADMLVRGSLNSLWDLDLEGLSLGAVQDPVFPWFGAPGLIDWRAVGVAPTTPYFNSGTMLIDLQAWRRQEIGPRCAELIRRHRLSYLDQCALNIAVCGEWARLGSRWNLQAGAFYPSHIWLTEEPEAIEEAMRDPAVVHFNTSRLGRPWQWGCHHPFAGEWFRMLDRTEFSGWRPAAPGPLVRTRSRMVSVARKVGRRLG